MDSKGENFSAQNCDLSHEDGNENEINPQLFEDSILSNPILAELIAKNFIKSDLLQCALVSLKWNSIFREFLRRSYRTPIRIRPESYREVCNVHPLPIFFGLPAFPTLSQPFNGVELDLVQERNSEAGVYSRHISIFQLGNWRKFIQWKMLFGDHTKKILEGIDLKHLIIKSSWESTETFTKLVQFYFDRLQLQEMESLKIDFSNLTWKCFLEIMQGKTFPNLQNITVSDWRRENDNNANLEGVHMILKIFPNLKKWFFPLHTSEALEFIRLNKAHLIKSLVINDYATIEDIIAFGEAELELTHLTIPRHTDLNDLRMFECLLRLIQQNVLKLKWIDFPRQLCIGLCSLNIPPFFKVTGISLTGGINSEGPSEEILSRLFPNVVMTVTS